MFQFSCLSICGVLEHGDLCCNNKYLIEIYHTAYIILNQEVAGQIESYCMLLSLSPVYHITFSYKKEKYISHKNKSCYS